MLNFALAIVLTEQKRRQCPCGAVANRPMGLCRKCQDRNAWRRKTTASHRKNNRRGRGRRIHDAARFLVGAVAMLTIGCNERGC